MSISDSIEATHELCANLDDLIERTRDSRAPIRALSFIETREDLQAYLDEIEQTSGSPSLGRDRVEGEEMTTPNHTERQFMQWLRGAGWVKSTALPDSPRTIVNLLRKGWIERAQTAAGTAYRLTAEGLQAKKTRLKITS